MPYCFDTVRTVPVPWVGQRGGRHWTAAAGIRLDHPVSARPRLHPDDRSGGQNPSVAFALCKVLERLPTWQAVLSPS